MQQAISCSEIASSGFTTRLRRVYFFLGALGSETVSSFWASSAQHNDSESASESMPASLLLAWMRPAFMTVNCSIRNWAGCSGYLSITSLRSSASLIIISTPVKRNHNVRVIPKPFLYLCIYPLSGEYIFSMNKICLNIQRCYLHLSENYPIYKAIPLRMLLEFYLIFAYKKNKHSSRVLSGNIL